MISGRRRDARDLTSQPAEGGKPTVVRSVLEPSSGAAHRRRKEGRRRAICAALISLDIDSRPGNCAGGQNPAVALLTIKSAGCRAGDGGGLRFGITGNRFLIKDTAPVTAGFGCAVATVEVGKFGVTMIADGSSGNDSCRVPFNEADITISCAVLDVE